MMRTDWGAVSRVLGAGRGVRASTAARVIAVLAFCCGEARAQSAASFPDVQSPPAPPATGSVPATPSPAPAVEVPAVPSGSAPASYPAAPAFGSHGFPPMYWAPAVLPYRSGQDVPPGYRLEESARTGLVAGGVVTFAIAYAGAIVLASSEGFDNGSSWLVAPVIGPWASIAARENPCRSALRSDVIDNYEVVDRKCINEALDEAFTIVLMTVDGLVQATGAALFVIGISSKERQLVRNDVATWRIGPRIGRGRFELSVGSAF